MIRLPQNQILTDNWRIFVIQDELTPGTLVTLEPKPIGTHKKTIQVYPFSPQQLKTCFKSIRMGSYCFCLQADQWKDTVWRDVLNMWLTELAYLRKKPTSYCKNTESIKVTIYMTLTYYARQKDLFGEDLSDDKTTQWDTIDDIHHCIFRTLHNIIQYHNMETSILDIISNPTTINTSLIEHHLPLQFHYYAESIARQMNTYLSKEHQTHYPPFLNRMIENNDNSLLLEVIESHESHESSTDRSPLIRETSV